MSITKKYIRINYELINDLKNLSEPDRQLINIADKAADSAYSPYSLYKVGAAVLLSSGRIVTGSNQENSAYPAGLCAERVAAFYAVSQFPDENIQKISIVAKNRKGKNLSVTPCGSCRQVLLEYEHKQGSPIEVLLFQGNRNIIIFRNIQSLLPLGFSRKQLPA